MWERAFKDGKNRLGTETTEVGTPSHDLCLTANATNTKPRKLCRGWGREGLKAARERVTACEVDKKGRRERKLCDENLEIQSAGMDTQGCDFQGCMWETNEFLQHVYGPRTSFTACM